MYQLIGIMIRVFIDGLGYLGSIPGKVSNCRSNIGRMFFSLLDTTH